MIVSPVSGGVSIGKRPPVVSRFGGIRTENSPHHLLISPAASNGDYISHRLPYKDSTEHGKIKKKIGPAHAH